MPYMPTDARTGKLATLGLDAEIADILVQDGTYDLPGKIRSATDEDLLEIDGIGESQLAAIRAVFPEFLA